MANKKATATKATKKTSKPTAAKPTKTKVTTVKAASASPWRSRLSQLKFVRTPLVSAAVAEFIGTFMLAVIILVTRNEPIYVMFGLAGIALLIAALSGAHVNPAVTIGAWVNRKIAGLRAVAYVVAQALGAMLAFVVVSAYVNAAPEVSEQAAMFGQQAAQIFTAAKLPEGSAWGMFFAELLGLTVLGFAYASAHRSRRRILSYSLTVGTGVFAALLIAGGVAAYITGSAVVNPAVAISVQALEWNGSAWPLLVYVVAPIMGGIIGFSLHKLLAVDENALDKESVA